MKKVAVLFGGNSTEREVSIHTGLSVVEAISQDYDVKPIEINDNYTSLNKKVKLTHLSPECKVLLLKANPVIADSIEESIDDPRYYVVTDLIDREI